VHRVSTTALERARRNDVRTILDIDYRPVLWGLTKRGDGATRFIASDTVTAHLQGILPLFDLVIGTEEEFAIAGGSTDIMAALVAIRRITLATLVVKRGSARLRGDRRRGPALARRGRSTARASRWRC